MWRNESRYKQGVKDPIVEVWKKRILCLDLTVRKTDGRVEYVADCEPFFAYMSVGLDLEQAKEKAIELLKQSLSEHAEQCACTGLRESAA